MLQIAYSSARAAGRCNRHERSCNWTRVGCAHCRSGSGERQGEEKADSRPERARRDRRVGLLRHPFTLFTLGLNGTWIGNLTALAPYKPLFIVGTLALLALGFYLVYRRPRAAVCDDGSYCARPASNRIAKIGLWMATVLVLAATTFSLWFRFIEP